MTSIFLLATPSCSRRAERGGIDFRPLRTVNHSAPRVPSELTDHSSKGIRLNSLLPYSVSFFFQPFSWDSCVIAPKHQRAVVSPRNSRGARVVGQRAGTQSSHNFAARLGAHSVRACARREWWYEMHIYSRRSFVCERRLFLGDFVQSLAVYQGALGGYGDQEKPHGEKARLRWLRV
jgi:hypothetical protein